MAPLDGTVAQAPGHLAHAPSSGRDPRAPLPVTALLSVTALRGILLTVLPATMLGMTANVL